MEEIIAALMPGGRERRNLISPSGGVKIHHLGIAVESLAQAVPIFQKLRGEGSRCGGDRCRPEGACGRLSTWAIAAWNCWRARKGIPPSRVLSAKRGPGIHHLALAVPDLPEALRKLESDGVRLIDREPRVGAGERAHRFSSPREHRREY